jgi:hypothetical protein
MHFIFCFTPKKKYKNAPALDQNNTAFASLECRPLFILDDEYGEKSVCVELDGQEAELTFIDHPANEMSVGIT